MYYIVGNNKHWLPHNLFSYDLNINTSDYTHVGDTDKITMLYWVYTHTLIIIYII